jgi:hypothetical protein
MALNLPAVLSTAKDADFIFMVELYIIYLKTGNLYLCAADQNITYDEQEYLALPLERDKVGANTESKVDDCKLKIANTTDEFTAALFSGTDFRGCLCQIFQILYPDALTDPTLVKPIMQGYLDSPLLNTKDATFEVEIKSHSPNTENYRAFKLSCNAEYADQESCFASKDEQTGTVQNGSTTHTIIIEQTKDDNFWINGIITCGYESRMIESCTGNTVTVRYPFSTIPIGSYNVIRGCDKSHPSCGTHYQQHNYGGFIGIPYLMVIRN